MHNIFVRARSITGIITENISYLFRKLADPTRMFSSEIQLRFSEIYVSMSPGRSSQAGLVISIFSDPLISSNFERTGTRTRTATVLLFLSLRSLSRAAAPLELARGVDLGALL